jgi:hypothetical protein
MRKVYLSDLTEQHMKEYLIQHFLDCFGRRNGRITLFPQDVAPYLLHTRDISVPSNEVVLKSQSKQMISTTLLQGKYAWFLEMFSLMEMLEMVEEARSRAWDRYHRLHKLVQAAEAEEGLLDLPFSDLYDWYGNDWVLFLFGYNAIGKTTWIVQQVTQLSQRTVVKTFERVDGREIAFVIAPLVTEFVLVDSGRFLPNGGTITRDQVIETIGPSMEEYSQAIRRPVPIAVCDAGDNFGQRVAMAIRAREVHREMHMEKLFGPWELTVPRNLSRERQEFSMNPEMIDETFQWMCKLFATSWNVRDMSPTGYHDTFERHYGQQKCPYRETFSRSDEVCTEMAHDPRILCERFCKHCPKHCPYKREKVVYPMHPLRINI